jgi:hypothetical protein
VTARIIYMRDYRAVFVLPGVSGISVFMASRGRPPRIAHERVFAQPTDAETYAEQLAAAYDCDVIDCIQGRAGKGTA